MGVSNYNALNGCVFPFLLEGLSFGKAIINIVFLVCDFALLRMDKTLTEMSIDVKHGLITVAAVIVGMVIYDRLIGPAIDKTVD